jgi:hypothetical protein
MKYGKIQELFSKSPSFLEFIKTVGADDDGIFTLDDGSVGVCYAIETLATETISDNELAVQAMSITALLSSIEEGMVAQFIFNSDGEIDERLEEYSNATIADVNPIVGLCEQKLLSAYKQGTEKPFFKDKFGGFYAKRIRVIITVRYFPKEIYYSGIKKIISDLMGGPDVVALYQKYEEEIKKEFKTTMSDLEGSLIQIGSNWEKLTNDYYKKLLYNRLNPEDAKSIPCLPYDPSRYMRDQVLFCFPEFDNESFTFQGHKTSVVTLREMPLKTVIGRLSREIEIGGKRGSMIDAFPDFSIVVNVHVIKQIKGKEEVEKARVKAIKLIQGNQAEGGRGNVIQQEKILAETTSFLDRVEMGGEGIMKATVHFVYSGTDPEMFRARQRDIKKELSKMGCEGIVQEEAGGGFFLHTLPLHYDPIIDDSTHFAKPVGTENVACLVPIYQSWRGTKTPDMMFLNRRGEVSYFSFWDTEMAPMGVVIGTSGSGKSFTMVVMLLSILRRGHRVTVFDRGYSYKKICDLYGGQFMNINPDNPVCVNPCAGVLSKNKESFLNAFFSQAASGGDPSQNLRVQDEAVLSKSVREAFQKKRYEITYRSDEDIERGKALGQGTMVYIDIKRKYREFVYDIPKDLNDLNGVLKSENNTLEMEVMQLLRIDQSIYDESIGIEDDGSLHADGLKAYMEAKNLLIHDRLEGVYDLEYNSVPQYEEIMRRTKGRGVKVDKNIFIHYGGHDEFEFVDLRCPGILPVDDLLGVIKFSEDGRDKVFDEVQHARENHGEILIRDVYECETWPEVERLKDARENAVGFKVYDDGSNGRGIKSLSVLVELFDEKSRVVAEEKLGVKLIRVNGQVFARYKEGRVFNAFVGDLGKLNASAYFPYQILDEGRCVFQKEVYLSDINQVWKEWSTSDRYEESTRRISGDLMLRMEPYIGDGIYNEFFDGPNQFRIEDEFTVIETGELNTEENWAAVFLFTMFNQMYEFAQTPDMRGKNKVLLMEEGWSYLRSKKSADFLANVYRTGRKFKFSCIVITQMVKEFLGSIGGEAILSNSPNLMLLKQDPKMIDVVGRQLDLSTEAMGYLRSVSMVKGSYSEIFILCDNGEGIMRIVPNPTMYWVATSDGDDNAYFASVQRRLIKEGLPEKAATMQALSHCSNHYPNGVKGVSQEQRDASAREVDVTVIDS